MYFNHEKLEVYQVALSVARAVAAVRVGCGLKDQLTRAANSIVLNIAEGAARRGDAQKNHYRIALGSAAEVAAGLDLARVDGEVAHDIRRVGAMLARLSR